MKICKRVAALLMALAVIISLLPGVAVPVDAATVDYVTASTKDFGTVILNWGNRGETATYLSQNAEAFYEDNNVSYALLSGYSGSSATSSVPSSDLYEALHELMYGALDEKTSYDQTRDLFQYTDVQNSGKTSNKISSFYSGTLIGPAWDSGSTWNREHCWPNSKSNGGSNNSTKRETDIMMLRPTSMRENSSRGNTAYGISNGYYNPNSESNGTYDLRGDVARIVLYVYTCWGGSSEHDGALNYMWGSSGVIESKDVLLQWMEQDPVDTWELGRNDSVESITGTRNVFVDYPELAFLLFNEEVPEMVTPSGEAQSDTVEFALSATSNNTAYGTVTVSRNMITATAKTGYEIVGYEVTDGSATVSRNGNVFTVNATSDCTVQINFAPRSVRYVTFMEEGAETAKREVYAGDKTTMPAHTGTLPSGYTFVGWTTAPVTETETVPTYVKAGAEYVPTGDVTFWALYVSSSGSGGIGGYVLVTNVNQLSVGAKVVIAAQKEKYAMSTTQNTNNRGSVAITKNADNTITFGDTVEVFTLEAGTKSGTYAFKDTTGTNSGQYLYSASSSKNYLKSGSKNDNASWNITVTTAGVATVKSQGGNTRNWMRFNTSNNPKLFASYSSGQTDIALYVESAGATNTYSSYIDCEHENLIVEDASDATCLGEGYTGDQICDDCGAVIYVGKEIPATGHQHTEVRDAAPATATQDGYTGDIWCTDCETLLENGEPIPATNAVAVDVATGTIYKDLTVALQTASQAQTAVTLQLQQNVAGLQAVVIPENVTLDLNGLTLETQYLYAVGALLDGVVGGEGLLKVGSTQVFLNANNLQLPLYDTEEGGYRFYTYSLDMLGSRTVDSNRVKFGFRLVLENIDGYRVLASTPDECIDMQVLIGWATLSAPAVYNFTDATVKEYASRAAEKAAAGENNTLAMVLTVAGLLRLEPGDVVTVETQLVTKTTMIAPGDEIISYAVPARQ